MVQTLSIKTKLIMAMLALVASVAIMGVTADAANAAGVTEIRWVENHTRYVVYFWNHEETKDSKLIPPYSSVSVNSRVPWATTKEAFNRGNHIELGWRMPNNYEYPQFAIWQEDRNTQPYPGDKIRYTSDVGWGIYGWYPHYNPNALPMDGASDTGGRRNLIITSTIEPNDWAPTMHARLCQPC